MVYILEELCDVFPTTFGPHPRIGVIVECRGHHMLLVLDSILSAFVTVIVRHVEPEGMIKNTHVHTQSEQDNEQDPHSICKTD